MAHIFTPALRRPLSKPFARSGTRTIIQRAIASLRARGSDAHLWLPGVGTLNGLTTGNYLESTGNSIATVDNPVGLVLDALGSVGAELSGTGDFSTGWAGVNASGWSLSGGSVVGVAATGYLTNSSIATTVGKTYLVTLTASARSAGQIDPYFEGALPTFYGMCTTVGVSRRIVTVTSGPGIALQLIGNSFTGSLDNISVREVSGIHLTQGTTANKGLLKQDAGSRYYWLFDATDLLTGTFPAGYESVTVIDAKSTGQVTTSAANVVGSYSIGPSYSSYGRIIINGSITASELALYQGFANKLAGL